MNQRRSNIEIIGEMLRIGANGAGKTEIMYSANMSYSQIQKYLKFLLAQGLIHKVELSNPHVTYVVTEKGNSLRKCIELVLETLNFRELDDK